MTRDMDKGHINLHLGIVMKENGRHIKNMGRANCTTKMENCTLVIGLRIRNKVRACTSTSMVTGMLGSGKKIKRMARAPSIRRITTSFMVVCTYHS
jgi:hypothetical protein